MMISLNDSWSNSLNNTSNKVLSKDLILWSSHEVHNQVQNTTCRFISLFVPIFIIHFHISLILNHDIDSIVLKMKTSNVILILIYTLRYMNITSGYNSVNRVSKKGRYNASHLIEIKHNFWWVVVGVNFTLHGMLETEFSRFSRLGMRTERRGSKHIHITCKVSRFGASIVIMISMEENSFLEHKFLQSFFR